LLEQPTDAGWKQSLTITSYPLRQLVVVGLHLHDPPLEQHVPVAELQDVSAPLL
jgi:hypothetical protein